MLADNLKPQPFLKWAGGKRQLLPEIEKYLPRSFKVYHESFVGAGALLFHLMPKKAIINDINTELVNCYSTILHESEKLIKHLEKHKNTKSYFYKIRKLDRTDKYESLSLIEKASRMIYLNKTCFNGLYRVNSQNFFNAPFGTYKNPNIINEQTIKSVSNYLNKSNIKILNTDFEQALKLAKNEDFIYLDPPYDPLTPTASFTSYSAYNFTKDDQMRLAKVFTELTKKGCKVMLSNSSTDFIYKLYKKYNIIKVPAKRNINSVASKRSAIDEFLILNYIP